MKTMFKSMRFGGGIGIHRPLAADGGGGATAGGSSQRLLRSSFALLRWTQPTPTFAPRGGATGGKQGRRAAWRSLRVYPGGEGSLAWFLAVVCFFALASSSLAFTSLPYHEDFGYADETPLAGQNGWSVFTQRPDIGILPDQYHGWVGYPGGGAIASNSLARLTGKSLLNQFGAYTKQPGVGPPSSSGQYDKATLVTIRYVLDLAEASAPDTAIREESRFGNMFWHGTRYHYENPGSYYMMMPVVRYFVKTNGLVSAYNGHLIEHLVHTPITTPTPLTVVVDYLGLRWSLWLGNEQVVNNYGLYKPWRGASVADYSHMLHDGWYKDYDGLKEVGFIDGTTNGVSLLDRVRIFEGLPSARAMPMIENFETRTTYGEEILMQAGNLNGQNAWFATGASVAAAAQNGDLATGGMQGVQINAGGDAFQLFLDGQTNVWTDFWMLPIASGSGSANVDAGGGHALFYVNDAGEVHAYDGAVTTNITTVAAGQWSRFTVHSDYATKTWSLYVGGNLVQADLAFKGNGYGNTYEELRFFSSGSAVSYVDDMVVHTESPFNVPSVSFATDSLEIAAGVTEITLTATLSWAFGMPITVSYVLQSDGTAMQVYGYTAGDGTFTFMPGETEQSVTFTITRDTFNYAEHDDTLVFVLTNLVNVTAGTHDQLTYTIRTNPEHFHVIPFSETFEHRTVGALDGQRGWQAKYVDVQAVDVYGGTKAARSERLGASLVHTFSNEPMNITAQWRAKAVLAQHAPTPPAGSTYAFYVDANGYIVAFDGATATNMGDVVVLTASTWAHFRVNADYTAKKWTLFVNGTQVLQDFDFYDDAAQHFGAFEVHGSVTIDNIDINYGPPATPTNLVAVATESQVALSWSPAQGAITYRLKRGTNPGGPYSLLASTSGTSFTDTSVLNGITYYYVVSALNAMGEGNNSAEAQATPRAKVTGLEAIGGIGRITLDWDAYEGATNYNVLRGTITGGPYELVATSEVNSLVDSNVVNGVTYYYRVTADTDAYTSMPSDEISASPALRTIFYDSFESPVVEGRIETSIPNWAPYINETGAAGNRVGLWNADSGSMSTPFGQQAAYIWSDRYIQTTSIEETLEAGAYYLLTFNVAAEWSLGDIYYSAALMAGSTILAETIAGWHIQENTFERADSIAFTVPEDHLAIGEPLGIRIQYYSGDWHYVLGVDNVRLQTSIDPPPVRPDPLTFTDGPAADSKTAISMTAESVTNGVGPITYRFENATTGENSGWSDSLSWTDTGLSPGTEYGYRVKARDVYGNENAWSDVVTAETFGANVMTNNVGADSWNNGDNWSNTAPPSGEESPRIAAGVQAVVVAAPPVYQGNLILDTGSSVQFGNAAAAGVLPGSDYQLQLHAGSSLKALTAVDIDASIVMLGDAEVLAGPDGNDVTFSGAISGSGKLTLAGDTGNQFHFNAASTHTGGIATRNAANGGHRVYANVNNAFGTGDVEIHAYASLYRLGGLSSTIANTATLYLNGAKYPTAPAKVVISGNETVFQLYVDGVVQPRGTHGSLASSAQHKSALFDGTGLLWVTVGDDDIYALSTRDITESSAVLEGKLDVPFTSRVVRAYWSTNENAGAAWLDDEDASSVIVGTYTEKVGQNLVRGLINLSPNMAYYYTFSASNAVDTIWGDTDTFATVGPPVLSNTGVSATGDDTATLAGQLTAGSFAETTFVWGTSDSGTNTIMDWAHRVPVGIIAQGVPITTAIQNLTYGVPYRYRLYGENAIGSGWSGVQTFLSGIPRDGETILVGIAGVDATNVTQTNATLQGVLDAPRATFTAHVYWSTNNLVTPAEWTAPGAADTAVIGTYENVVGQGLSHPVIDLDYNTTYYYTFRIENPATNIWAAASKSFSTQGGPAVTNIGARNVSAGIAELRGELLDGVYADAYIVLDTEDRGTATNAWSNMLVVSGVTESEPFGAMATGLVYGVQYVYRIYVENAFGHDWSDAQSFWTLPPVEPEPLASGGVATNLYTDGEGKLWYAHVFTGNGTFTAATALDVEYLIVAGGGGGGGVRAVAGEAGGGGAGGLVLGATSILAGGHAVTVGAGGAGGAGGWSIPSTRGANGGNSAVFGAVADGGGGGGHPTLTTGRVGGSGGGGSHTGVGGAGTTGQGNTGGSGASSPSNRGGGGGGAGGTSAAPDGGAGLTLAFSGTEVTYATGGKGGVNNVSYRQSGAPNTGDGGSGASSKDDVSRVGGDGGSGIVVVRYEVVPGLDLAVRNTTVTNVAATTVDIVGELDAFGAVMDVTAYWSTTDHADAAAWLADGSAQNASVGSYTNVIGQELLLPLSGLTQGTTYYYTFMATNTLTNIWASPNMEFGTKGAPQATTASGPTNETYGAVTLQGLLTAGGEADAYIVWDTSDRLTASTGAWAHVESVGTQLQGFVFDQVVTGLLYGIEYSYRVYVSNENNVGWSDVATFTSTIPESGGSPLVAVRASEVSAIGATSATIHGELDATQSVFAVTAYWSTSNNLSLVAWQADGTAGSAEVGSFTNMVGQPLSSSAINLTSDTVYYYTFVASNVATNLFAVPNGTFVTEGPPAVSMIAVTNIGVGTVDIVAELTAGGVADAWLVWGAEDGLNTSSGDWEHVASIGQVTQDNVFTNAITDLLYGVDYFSRIFAANSFGSHGSGVTNFMTAAPAGIGVANQAIADVGITSATLRGTLNATQSVFSVYAFLSKQNNATAEAWTNDTSKITALIGTYTNVVGESLVHPVENLDLVTTYYYTFMASNVVGELWATPNASFSTVDQPLVSATGATANGPTQVNLAGSLAQGYFGEATFVWDTADQLTGSTGDWAHALSVGVVTQGVDFAVGATGLLYGPVYSYRVYVTNEAGYAWSDAVPFSTVTPGTLEIAGTNADGVETTSAYLQAMLTAPQSVFTVTSYWSTNNNASVAAWTNDNTKGIALVGTFTNVVDKPLSVQAAPLLEDTTYYYTFVASNALTQIWSTPNVLFRTARPESPVIGVGNGADPVGYVDATLHGIVEIFNGTLDAVRMYLGHDDGGTDPLLWETNYVFNVAELRENVMFSTNVTGLAEGSNYYYRVYATNAFGEAWSDAVLFTTLTAADGTWLGVSGNWTNASVWVDGVVARGTDRTANFTGVNITEAQVITNNTAIGIGHILFTDETTSDRNLTIAAGEPLTLTVSSGSPTINVTQSGRTLTIGTQLAGAQGFTKLGAGTLTLSGNNTFGGGISLQAGGLTLSSQNAWGGANQNITFTGSATLTAVDGHTAGQLAVDTGMTATITARNLTFDSVIGDGSIIFASGNRTLTLKDADAFYGNIRSTAGGNGQLIRFGTIGDVPGSGNLQFGGGSTDSNQVLTMGLFNDVGPLTLHHRRIEFVAKPGNWSFRDANLINSNSDPANTFVINTDLLNMTDRNHNFILRGVNTGDNTFAGAISDSARGTYYSTQEGILSLQKVDNGKWILSGTNTYSGNTTVSAGTLGVAVDKALPAATTLLVSGSGEVDLADDVVAHVNALTLGDVVQPSGVYGSNDSTAPNKSAYFTGNGLLYVGAAPPALSNTMAANVTLTSADLQGILDTEVDEVTVTAYWSTNNHATLEAWLADGTTVSAPAGTFDSVVDQPLSVAASGLADGTTYYYTFTATNETLSVWASPNGNFTTLMPETDPPVLLAVSPTNSAVDVAVSTNLVATFDEDIYLVAGKTITVSNLTAGTATVITLPDLQVTTAISNLVIDLSTDLAFGANYAILIEDGAITDFFENAYEGITDTAVWQFTTDERPVIDTLSPTNNATGVILPANLVATFNEPVTVADASGIVLTNLTIHTARPVGVSVDGSTLTIDPVGDLEPGHTYAVLIRDGAIVNGRGSPFAGIANTTTWRFTATTDINWSLVAYWPLNDGEDGATVASAIEVINHPTYPAQSGVPNNALATWTNDPVRGIVLYSPEDHSLDAGQQEITGDITWSVWVKTDDADGIILGNRSATTEGSGWNRLMPAAWDTWSGTAGFSSVGDGTWHHLAVRRAGNQSAVFRNGVQVSTGTPNSETFKGAFRIGGDRHDWSGGIDAWISDVAIWTEALSPTRIAELAAGGPVILTGNPNVESFHPTNGASIRIPPFLSVTFDQNMQKGAAGNITIMNLTSNTSEVIPISSSRITISGAVVTITPTSLVEDQTFAVLIDYGALESVGAAMPFAGIVDTNTWRFNALNNGSVFRFR